MKNLNYVACVEINEYDDIASAKNNPTKTELRRLRNAINLDYQNYLSQFVSIVNRSPSVYNQADSATLRHSYKSPTIPLGELIQRIIDAQIVEFQGICGYCLFYPRTTMDHYVPQEEYSEFSVLARNLLPSCQPCNTTKNQFWRQNNHRLFLHLYNDNIPYHRFLFGILTYNQSLPVISYHIQNQGNVIDAVFFSILTTHFDRLALCKLYQSGTSGVIADIHTSIKGLRRIFPSPLTMNQLQDFLLTEAVDLKLRYGINYWKAIAMEILANSHHFLLTL